MKSIVPSKEMALDIWKKQQVFDALNSVIGDLQPDLELIQNILPDGKPIETTFFNDVETVAIVRRDSILLVQSVQSDSPACMLKDIAAAINKIM